VAARCQWPRQAPLVPKRRHDVCKYAASTVRPANEAALCGHRPMTIARTTSSTSASSELVARQCQAQSAPPTPKQVHGPLSSPMRAQRVAETGGGGGGGGGTSSRSRMNIC